LIKKDGMYRKEKNAPGRIQMDPSASNGGKRGGEPGSGGFGRGMDLARLRVYRGKRLSLSQKKSVAEPKKCDRRGDRRSFEACCS